MLKNLSSFARLSEDPGKSRQHVPTHCKRLADNCNRALLLQVPALCLLHFILFVYLFFCSQVVVFYKVGRRVDGGGAGATFLYSGDGVEKEGAS